MARKRFVEMALWSQMTGWTTAQKCALVYLQSHPESSLCGCFVVHPGVAAVHLALRGGQAEAEALLASLRPRAFYLPPGWVFLPRYRRTQGAGSGKPGNCADDDWGALPADVRKWAQSIMDTEGSDSLSIGYPESRIAPDTDTEGNGSEGSEGARGGGALPVVVAPSRPKKPRKENPLWEAAKRVCLEHMRLCALPGEPSTSEIKIVIECLGGGMTEEQCMAVSKGAIRDPYHTGKLSKWPGIKLGIRQCFGDVSKARALSSAGLGMDHRDNAEAWTLS